MKIEIRNDLTVREFNELITSLGWGNKGKHIIENAFKNSVIIKKALYDNEIVGMARVIGDGVYYLVVDVVVKPKYQGYGIGKIMMDEIVWEIEDKTEEGQSSSIVLIANEGKEGFYEKCGFIKVPFEYSGYGMMKRIDK